MFMGRSEQERRLLLVSDQEHPNSHQSSDGGVDCNSSATGFLLFTAIVAATCSFTSGYCIGYSSPAEYGVLADLSLSMAEYSVFGSMLAVGGMIGALVSGKTADYFGHRTTMWIINVFFILGWLAIAFTKVSWLLDLGRLLQGIGIALTSYVGNIFIAEITPKNLRGGLMSLNSWMTGSGVAIVYLIGSVVKWRGLALIGSIPCLLQILCLFFIPESPRWLVKNGREKEFEGVLQRLRGKKADISPEAAEIKEYAEFIQLLSENKFLDLFQKKYARPITVAVGLMILTQFSGLTGYTFYMTNIFVLAGISSEAGYVTLAVVKILSTTLAIFLIDKSGRRTLLMVSAAGTCLGSLLTGFSFLLQDHHFWISVLALTGVSVYLVSFNLGISGIPWIIMSEIFPINVKGSAGSLCVLIYWISSWAVSYTFNFLLEWSSTGTFIIFAAVSALGFLFTVMLVPETKGRSLEEIQASVTKGVCYAKKDFNLAKHPEIDVPNLQVIKLMQSFKSKEYVRETFAWMYYYWYLTNDGIEFLRTYLNLPSEIVPATLKKQSKPAGCRPFGGPPGDRPRGPPRFEGDRRRFGDRDGYRGGPRGGEGGEKEGAPADYQPAFRGRPGFGLGGGGYGAAQSSSPGFA